MTYATLAIVAAVAVAAISLYLLAEEVVGACKSRAK